MHETTWPTFNTLYPLVRQPEEAVYNNSLTVVVLAMLTLYAVLMLLFPKIKPKYLVKLLLIRRGDNLGLRENGFQLPIRLFYIVQALLLSAICLEPFTHNLLGKASSTPAYWQNIGIVAGGLLLAGLLVYLAYHWIGYTFLTPQESAHWRIAQLSLISLWGLTLYLPTTLLLLTSLPPIAVLGVFALLYILMRIVIVSVSVRVFVTGLQHPLHLFLYLCGCEIAPMLFIANVMWQASGGG